jgi:hypothetical protein
MLLPVQIPDQPKPVPFRGWISVIREAALASRRFTEWLPQEEWRLLNVQTLCWSAYSMQRSTGSMVDCQYDWNMDLCLDRQFQYMSWKRRALSLLILHQPIFPFLFKAIISITFVTVTVKPGLWACIPDVERLPYVIGPLDRIKVVPIIPRTLWRLYPSINNILRLVALVLGEAKMLRRDESSSMKLTPLLSPVTRTT